MNVVLYNPYTEIVWRWSLNEFNQNMKPAEEYAAKKIKEKLLCCSANVLQVSILPFCSFFSFHVQIRIYLYPYPYLYLDSHVHIYSIFGAFFIFILFFVCLFVPPPPPLPQSLTSLHGGRRLRKPTWWWKSRCTRFTTRLGSALVMSIFWKKLISIRDIFQNLYRCMGSFYRNCRISNLWKFKNWPRISSIFLTGIKNISVWDTIFSIWLSSLPLGEGLGQF